MNLIDTHAHIYLTEFSDDTRQVIDRALSEGVTKVYLPAIDHTVFESILELEAAYPDTCMPMAGVHPCSVKENFRKELDFAANWLQQRKFAGIGEVGLDFYWDKTFLKEQYLAFEEQIKWGGEFDLPIIIHSREAGMECLEVIRKYQTGRLKGIFHCFTGDVSLGKGIIDAGFYLGIGGVITYKNAGLAEALKELPLENMVLETDAPYLSPVPFRGKRNESSYLKYIVQKLADVKGVSEEEVAEITTANAQKIFGG